MNSEFNLQFSANKRATAARSQFYKILSRVFAYPSSDEMQAFVREGAMIALYEAADDLPFNVSALTSSQDRELWNHVDLETTYSVLFDNCTGRAQISLHEKDYSKKEMKQTWEELIRFYEHFGLQYDLKTSKVYPDHIGVQLEFLHYLTFLESATNEDMEGIYVAAERDFLERHVAEWIKNFTERLRGAAASTPYAALAQVLNDFIREELEFNRMRRTIQ